MKTNKKSFIFTLKPNKLRVKSINKLIDCRKTKNDKINEYIIKRWIKRYKNRVEKRK